jgi:hypothetical protein
MFNRCFHLQTQIRAFFSFIYFSSTVLIIFISFFQLLFYIALLAGWLAGLLACQNNNREKDCAARPAANVFQLTTLHIFFVYIVYDLDS